MKSVLIIEDRKSRQENMLGKKKCQILRELEGVTVSARPEEVIEQLNAGNQDVLANFSLIIIHRSSIKQTGLNTLYEFGAKNNSSLVLFSGAINSVSYIKDKFELLQLSSLELYSLRLINFLENYLDNNSEHLIEIAYGEKWRLNFLLQYRQLLFFKNQKEDLLREDLERNNVTKIDLMIVCENVLGNKYSNDTTQAMKDVDKEIKTIMAQL